jgi:hypothetical protein
MQTAVTAFQYKPKGPRKADSRKNTEQKRTKINLVSRKRYAIFSKVNIKKAGFLYLTPCRMVYSYQNVGKICYHNLQGRLQP